MYNESDVFRPLIPAEIFSMITIYSSPSPESHSSSPVSSGSAEEVVELAPAAALELGANVETILE